MIKEKGKIEKPIISVLYIAIILFLTLTFSFLTSSFFVGKNITDIFWHFFRSSIGSLDGFLRTLMRAAPILISTLGLIVAFRSGIWNIGGEGQIIIGIIVTTGICLFLEIPPTLAIVLSFFASFIASGVYGAFAGFLKARWDVNEIAITMMQTFVASALLQYLVDKPWNWGIGLYPRTAMIPPETRLPFVKYPLNTIFVISIALTVITWFLLNETVLGYKMRAMGSNKMAAFSYGIDITRLTVFSMIISGGLCGLAGTGLVLGEYFRAQVGISGNYGFYAIAAALMADNKVSLAPFSSLLIAFLYQGTLGVTALGLPHRLGEAIIGVTFIMILLPKILRGLKSR